VDNILFDCKLLEHEREKLKAAVIRPVRKDKLSTKFYKNFKEFTNSISVIKVEC
jgi:hypothetical protein